MNAANHDDENEKAEEVAAVAQKLDSKTITIIVALLFGAGGVGTGALGLATKDDITSMRQEIKEMKDSVDIVATSLVELKVGSSSAIKDISRLERRIDDHEQRLRNTERLSVTHQPR